MLEKSGKLTNVIDDHMDEIEDSQIKITKSAGLWNSALEKTKQLASTIMGPISAIFSTAGIMDTVGAMLRHNTQMKELSFRMGEAGKSAKFLTSEMHRVTMETGASTDQSAEMINMLRRARIATKDVGDLTEATIRFSTITGVAAADAGKLAGELSRMGRLGPRQIESVMTSMAQVQRIVGMTEQDMTQLNDSIIESTRYLSQLGKTGPEIVRFSKGVANLAAAFTKVGLSAQDAAKLIDDLLDPGKIEDNALMYAKLGISIEDAITGNIDPDQMIGALRDMGQEFKEMSGPAAASLAKSMGLTLKQARSFADMTQEQLTGQGDLTKMYEEQLSPQQKMEQAMNRLQGTLQQLATGLLPIIEGLAGVMNKVVGVFQPGKGAMAIGIVAAILGFVFLISRIKKRFFSMNTEVARHQENLTAEALIMGRRKADAATARGGRGRGRETDLSARVRAGTGFKEMQAEAERFGTIAETNLVGPVRRFVQGTEQWLRTISEGAKPVSLLRLIAEKNNQVIKNRLGFVEEERNITVQTLRNREEELATNHQNMQNRLKQLQSEKQTAEAIWEQKRIATELEKTGNRIAKIGNERERQENRFSNLRESALRKLAPEERYNMLENMKRERNRLETIIAANQRRFEGIEIEDKMLRLQKEILIREERKLKIQMESGGKVGAEEVEKYNRITKQLRNIGDHLEENKRTRSAITTEIGEAVDEQGRLGREIAKVTGAGSRRSTQMFSSVFRKGGDILRSVAGRLGNALSKGADRVKNSAISFVKALGQRLNPKNWLAAFKARRRQQREEGAGRNRLSGGLGKVAKVMGILIGVLLASKAVREAMKKIFESLKPSLEQFGKLLGELAQKLGPAITQMIRSFMPMIMMLLKSFLPIFIDILNMAMPIIIKLVNFFMPKLLLILGHLIFGIGSLARSIGEFINTLPGAEGKGKTMIDLGTTAMQSGIGILESKYAPIAPWEPVSKEFGAKGTTAPAAGKGAAVSLIAEGSRFSVAAPELSQEEINKETEKNTKGTAENTSEANEIAIEQLKAIESLKAILAMKPIDPEKAAENYNKGLNPATGTAYTLNELKEVGQTGDIFKDVWNFLTGGK